MMTQPPMQDKFIIKTEPLLTNFTQPTTQNQ